MECYPNCGCSERGCQLGLPPMVKYAPIVVEEELSNDLFRLQGWMPLDLPIVVTGPLVVLTALSEEPLVLVPQYRFELREEPNPKYYTLLRLEDWAKHGYPNWGAGIDYPKTKSIGSAGLRKLIRAGSWYASGNPIVRKGVYTLGLENGMDNLLRPATIEERVRHGWDGSWTMTEEEREKVKSPQLYWSRMFLAQLKWRPLVSVPLRLWAAICLWTNSWKPKKWRKIIPLSSPLIEMQRARLLITYTDTDFSAAGT